jgi:RecA/RadA recombinase
MAKNYLQKLQNLEGAITEDINPHERVIRSPSPSVNVTFGKGHGLPRGLTLALGGPPKGGKTLLCNAFTGQLHRDDPEAFVIKYNTEYRELGQSTPEEREKIWGIDRHRYQPFEVNSPMLVFDRIEQEVAALCEDGMPLGLVIIDSVTGIQGRRSMNADTIETQQIGDLALTLGEGFKRILPVQRKYGFAVILTCHIRAEMDLLEKKRGNTWRMALPLAVQHYAEYSMFIEPNRNKEGRTDLSGNEFRDANLKDLNDTAEQTGHKIRVKMKDSSCGPKGRMGEFTLDYRKGIVNIHEEVFLLGVGRGVILRPNNQTYVFRDDKWVGKPATLAAIQGNLALQQAILAEVKERDNAGAYDAEDAANLNMDTE